MEKSILEKLKKNMLDIIEKFENKEKFIKVINLAEELMQDKEFEERIYFNLKNYFNYEDCKSFNCFQKVAFKDYHIMESNFIDMTKKVRKMLTIETDRGCVLISVSFLEYQIEQLLEVYFVRDEKAVKELFKNGLSSFSAKINLVYLLGLIGNELYRDLNMIRKIRNEFAHSYDSLSFESDCIKNRCLEFSGAYEYLDRTNMREVFIRHICSIFGFIQSLSFEYKNEKRIEGKNLPSSDTNNDFKDFSTVIFLESLLDIYDKFPQD